ncbi:hypothetical protein B0H67DRAFT_631846 [Lasiosphaeris hirsuta]|uniref:Uncharacterized protein n=1 Tax=Lasiosphaeris hirsuta TaxID=260670 RepID=A0AA40E8D8_9PEZI|nr:hypothetical protein B0H67DRAFT_631846 [Lasiosphaeris hirsuta]
MTTVSTVVFITGAGRGIGKTLVQTYLLRPDHIVIGSVRDRASPNAQELQDLPTATGTRLLLVNIESSSPTDATNAVKDLRAAGIGHVDVVIANAGGSGSRGAAVPLQLVDPKAVAECFGINTLGPLLLFQAIRPLLQKSSKSPTWVAITSAVGSIGNMEAFGSHVAPAYGISKVGLNWVTQAAHSGNKWLIAFVVHPGLVQTEGGNRAAKAIGLEKAPHTQQQSADAIIHLVDAGSRENSSGKFYNAIDGTEIPW